MCIIDQTISTSVYISQIEQHIQMLQHLVQALKLSEQQARMQRHPFGPTVYPQSPIQNLFNQSMTGGFANSFGPRAETNPKTNTSGNVTAWVSEVRLAQVVVSGIAPTYELHLTNSRGEHYTRTYTLKEFAQATANNGILNHLINMVTTSPKSVNGSAWLVDGGQILITIDNLGSFVADENILPFLRLTRPIIDLRTKPMPIPDTTPPTANFLITRVLGRYSNVGDFEIEGYVSNGHPHKLSQTVISIIDLPMYIGYPNGLKPTKEHPRTAWILSPNVVLTLLDIDGVLMNEVIKLKDLGEYPNTNVLKDFCEGVENIDPFPVGEKVAEEDLCEMEITHFSNIRQDLVKWLETWCLNDVEVMEDDGVDGLVFNLLSTTDDRRHKLEITDNFMVKWFENRSDQITDGRTLTKVAREMSENSRIVATIITFEALKTAIIQILPAEDGVPLRLYTTDLKRAKRFIEATKDLNSRWFNVAKD